MHTKKQTYIYLSMYPSIYLYLYISIHNSLVESPQLVKQALCGPFSYIYIHPHMYTYLSIYLSISISIYIHLYICICIRIYIKNSLVESPQLNKKTLCGPFSYIYIHPHKYTYLSIYLSISIFIYIHLYIWICIRIYIENSLVESPQLIKKSLCGPFRLNGEVSGDGGGHRVNIYIRTYIHTSTYIYLYLYLYMYSSLVESPQLVKKSLRGPLSLNGEIGGDGGGHRALYMYVYIHRCMYTHMYACRYIYIHLYIYIYMHICIYNSLVEPAQLVKETLRGSLSLNGKVSGDGGGHRALGAADDGAYVEPNGWMVSHDGGNAVENGIIGLKKRKRRRESYINIYTYMYVYIHIYIYNNMYVYIYMCGFAVAILAR